MTLSDPLSCAKGCSLAYACDVKHQGEWKHVHKVRKFSTSAQLLASVAGLSRINRVTCRVQVSGES